MAIRFALMPKRTNAAGYSGPTHFTLRGDPSAALLGSTLYEAVYYGLEPVALVASDLTGGQVTQLSAESDVTMVPANLNNTVGANVTTVQNKLEAFNIPAIWVQASDTYRQVLRAVFAIFKIAEYLRNVGEPLLPSGVSLTTPYSDMPEPYRTHLVAAIDAHQYDRSSLGAGSTLRQLLEMIQAQGTPFTMFGVSI